MVTIDSEKQLVTNKIAQRIRQLRIEQKLSQEDLALRAGINPAYFGHLERGLKCPTIDTINKIVVALGISLTDFFDYSTPVVSYEYATKRFKHAIQNVSEYDAMHIVQIVEDIVKLIKKEVN